LIKRPETKGIDTRGDSAGLRTRGPTPIERGLEEKRDKKKGGWRKIRRGGRGERRIEVEGQLGRRTQETKKKCLLKGTQEKASNISPMTPHIAAKDNITGERSVQLCEIRCI